MAHHRSPVPTYRHSRTGRAVIVHAVQRSKDRVPSAGPVRLGGLTNTAAPVGLPLQANAGRLPASPGDSALRLRSKAHASVLRSKVAIDYVDSRGTPLRNRPVFARRLRPLFTSGPAREGIRRPHAGDCPSIDGHRARGRATRTAAHVESGRPVGWSRGNVNRSVAGSALCSAGQSSRRSFRFFRRRRSRMPGAMETGPWRRQRSCRSGGEVVQAACAPSPAGRRRHGRVQLLSSARPEICELRDELIDRSGPIWIYRPAKHKTLHHGHARSIVFGPQAQLVLRISARTVRPPPFFATGSGLREIQTLTLRKTPVQPSQVDRTTTATHSHRCDLRSASMQAIAACKQAGVRLAPASTATAHRGSTDRGRHGIRQRRRFFRR